MDRRPRVTLLILLHFDEKIKVKSAQHFRHVFVCFYEVAIANAAKSKYLLAIRHFRVRQ